MIDLKDMCRRTVEKQIEDTDIRSCLLPDIATLTLIVSCEVDGKKIPTKYCPYIDNRFKSEYTQTENTISCNAYTDLLPDGGNQTCKITVNAETKGAVPQTHQWTYE